MMKNIDNKQECKKNIKRLAIGATAFILAISGYKLCKESKTGYAILTPSLVIDKNNNQDETNNIKYDYESNQLVVADGDKINVTKGAITANVSNRILKTKNLAIKKDEIIFNNLMVNNIDKYTSISTDYPGLVCFNRHDEKGIFIQSDNAYTIGLPENYYGQATDTIVFFDMEITDRASTIGKEGYDNYQYKAGSCIYQEDMVDTIMDQNPNTVVVVVHSAIGNKKINEMLDVLDSIGINSNRTLISGFSGGGNTAIETAEKIINNHKNIHITELFLIDCNHTIYVTKSIDFLAANGVKCTLLHKLNDLYLKNNYAHIINSGMDFSVINLVPDWFAPSGSQHLAKKNLAINGNYFGYILGNTNAPLDYDYSDTIEPFEYLHYNQATNSFEHISQDRKVIDIQEEHRNFKK